MKSYPNIREIYGELPESITEGKYKLTSTKKKEIKCFMIKIKT